jgi:serine/threonine protein kinase
MKKQTTKVHRYEMKTWLQSLLFEFNPHCYNTAKCECLGLNSPGVCVKLADFGMSKGGALLHVSSGNCQGTVAYIAPERIAYNPGAHNHDFYALGDIYALGLFVWEVLYYVHHCPVRGGGFAGLSRQQRHPRQHLQGEFQSSLRLSPRRRARFFGKVLSLQPRGAVPEHPARDEGVGKAEREKENQSQR